jgi:exopolysaccharide production protein ExoQ
MSFIYLLATLVFIVVLFRQDQKEWPHFSKSLWIPVLWLISSTTRLVQILFPTGGSFGGPGIPSIEKSLEGNPTFRMIYSLLILAAIVALFGRRNALSAFWRANRGIYILYAYMLLTLLWTPYPEVSIKRFIKMGGCLLMAFLVASEEDHHRAIEHVFRRYIAVCLTLSLFFVKTDRSIGYVISVHGDHFMAGIANHKNDLGILCVYSLIFLFMRALRLWPSIDYLDAVLIAIDAYFLVRARSETALVLALLGTALMIGMKVAGSFKRIAILVIVLLIIALPVLMITLNSPNSTISGAFFSATGKDATLTGRIPMWKDLISLGRKDIFLGSGYEGYWIRYYHEIWARYTFLPVTAHNGFIEVLLNLGLVGLAIIISIILGSLSLLGSNDSLSRPHGRWEFAVLIIFIISNITESWFIIMSLGWNLFLIVLTNSGKDRFMRAASLKAPSP